MYFLFEVFQAFFDRSFASAVVNSALAFNIFEVPFVRGKPSYVSVRCLLNTHHPYGLMAVNHRYPCRRFSTLARVGGAGYRVLARLDHYRNRHDSRVYAMYTKPLAGPTLEWWLGRGAPLNPYLRASIIHFLREEMRPKELRLIPDDLFATEKVKDFLEWSILRSWMKDTPPLLCFSLSGLFPLPHKSRASTHAFGLALIHMRVVIIFTLAILFCCTTSPSKLFF